jgi:hypothetical protein
MIIYECGPVFEDFSVRMNADEKLNLLESEINFLMESIDSDSIISESFILEDGNIFLSALNKILLVLQKLGDAIVILINKLVTFIREKIKEFKQKNLIGKLKKGKLTKDQTNKIAEKLNKMKLYNAKALVEYYTEVGLSGLEAVEKGGIDKLDAEHGNFERTVEAFKTIMKLDIDTTARVDDRVNNDHELEKLYAKFEPQQLVDNFQNIYNETSTAVEELKPGLETTKQMIDGLEKEIKKLRDQAKSDRKNDELKNAIKNSKDLVQGMKLSYEAGNKIFIKLTKQKTFLDSLALYLLHQDSGETSDNGVEKVSGDVVDNDGNPV